MVRMPLDDQFSEIAQGEASSPRGKLFCVDQPSQNLRHLDVNEMRRVDTLGGVQCAGSHPLSPGRLQHQLHGR